METKPKIDCSGIKVGSQIGHKIFGEGKVVQMKENMITVTFGKAEKRFRFPEAIENGFLKII